MRLVGFIIRIYHDARSAEGQTGPISLLKYLLALLPGHAAPLHQYVLKYPF